MPDGSFDPDDLTPVYEEAGKKYGWDPDLLRAQTKVESNDKPYAVSEANAQGISQFIPRTARAVGLRDPFDPHESIPAQAKLLRDATNQFGSTTMAVGAYHGGTDPASWGPKTHSYIDAVNAEYARLKAARQQTAQAAPQQPKPPTIGDQIKAARQAGYNDDEIADYLGKSPAWAPKFEAARKSGYLDDDIYGHLGLKVQPGLPLTNKQAIAQLPAAKTDTPPARPVVPGTAPPGPPPTDKQAMIDEIRNRSGTTASGHVWEKMKEGYENAPLLLTPMAQAWADKYGLGGDARTLNAVLGGFMAVWGGVTETANQIGIALGQPQLARDAAAMIESAGMTGAPHGTLHTAVAGADAARRARAGVQEPPRPSEPSAAPTPQPEAPTPPAADNKPPPAAAPAPSPQPAAPPARTGNPMLDRLAAQAAQRRAERAAHTPPASPEQAAAAEAHAELEQAAQGKPATPPAPVEQFGPPAPVGTTRFYHGGDERGGGSRWLTPDLAYAQGYAAKSGEPRVSYVDIPNDSPLLKKAFEDEGSDVKAPFVHFDAPPEIAAQLRPIESAGPPEVYGPATAPEVPQSSAEALPKPTQIMPGLIPETAPKPEEAPPSAPAAPRIRTVEQIQAEDGVGQKKAQATQMEEIAAVGRPITAEEAEARKAGVAAPRAEVGAQAAEGRRKVDVTGLQFLDGDKPVYYWSGKDTKQVLGDRAAELNKYPHIEGPAGRVWYKPGEEARAQRVQEIGTEQARLIRSGSQDLARLATLDREIGNALGYDPAAVDRYVAGKYGAPPAAEATPRGRATTPFEAIPREPQRLVNFLRSSTTLNPGTIHETVIPGGIKDVGGDLKAILGGTRGRPGLINNKSGRSFTDAMTHAWENGYFPESAEAPRDDRILLDAIRADHSGAPRYSIHDQDHVEAYHAATEGNREIYRLASEHGIETQGKTRAQFFDELSDRLSIEERAQQIASQHAAHEAAYREAEKAAKQWVAEHQGEEWRADKFYGMSQARTLEDLEREHAAEAQSHPSAPAGGERPTRGAEPGSPGEHQGAVSEGSEPRGRGAGAGRGSEAQGAIKPKLTDDQVAAIVTASRTAPTEKLGQINLRTVAKSLGLTLNRTDLERVIQKLGEPAPAADLLGKPVAEPRSKATPEPTIRNDPNQITMPGTEPSAVQAQAARDAQGRGALQSDVGQKPPDEGLFAPDTSGQGKLYAGPGAIFDPEAWRRAFGPLAPIMRRLKAWTGPKAESFTSALFPMTGGTIRSQAMVTDFAHRLRGIEYAFGDIDKKLVRDFTIQERDTMGRALDAQSVFEQQIRDMTPEQRAIERERFAQGGTGIDSLSPRQRQIIDSLDAISQDAWLQMQERGMVKEDARPLPYYMPRQILMWSEESGFSRPTGGGGGGANKGIDARGDNLTTAGPMRRKNLLAEDTLAGAKAELGENATLLRDIRSLPSRLAYTYRAIAGVDLMRDIEEVGRHAGVNLVVRGDIPGIIRPGEYFTMSDHPSFRRWTGTGWQAIHVANEFRGPLESVLSKRTGELYRMGMKVKGGLMRTIMWSPFMHLNVEVGRALPMMRHEMVSVFKDGHRVRQDPGYMETATRDGVAPLGQRSGWSNDPVSIADMTMEPSRNVFIKSILAARDAVINRVPYHAMKETLRDPHQFLLWDRVFDLQMGIYDNLKRKWIADGFPDRVAGIMAAHEGNRYAGALPPENLARSANMAANLLLFSRSFTLGNLGVIKDMFNGAPSHTRALIEHEFDPEMANKAQSAMRRKAIGAFTLDIGLQYIGTALGQFAWRAGQLTAIAGGASYLATGLQQALGEWYDRAAEAMEEARSDPQAAFGIFPQHWNEPGKQDRVFLGVDPQSGRGVYARLAIGKIGEEFMGWFTRAGDLLMAKLNVGVRPIVESIFGRDTLGRELIPPYPQTIGDRIDAAGLIVKHIGESFLPTSLIQGGKELYQHHVQGKEPNISPATSWAKVLLPATGFGSISQGFPGGPAAGEMHAQREREQYAITKGMPAVRDKIKAGDTEGAMADMVEMGVPPPLRRYFMRQTQNPGISPGAMKRIPQAPPEIQLRMRHHLGESAP